MLGASAADPIVGNWRSSAVGVKGSSVWTFQADGSVSNSKGVHGIWKSVKSPAVERKYEIQWRKGDTTVTGELDRAGRKANFKDSNGWKYDLVRIDVW